MRGNIVNIPYNGGYLITLKKKISIYIFCTFKTSSGEYRLDLEISNQVSPFKCCFKLIYKFVKGRWDQKNYKRGLIGNFPQN